MTEPLAIAAYPGPSELKHAWSMGGRIFDLSRRHLDRLAELVGALDQKSKPPWLRDAEAQLAETAGLRRLARALDVPEDVMLHQWARGEFAVDPSAKIDLSTVDVPTPNQYTRLFEEGFASGDIQMWRPDDAAA